MSILILLNQWKVLMTVKMKSHLQLDYALIVRLRLFPFFMLILIWLIDCKLSTTDWFGLFLGLINVLLVWPLSSVSKQMPQLIIRMFGSKPILNQLNYFSTCYVPCQTPLTASKLAIESNPEELIPSELTFDSIIPNYTQMDVEALVTSTTPALSFVALKH